MVKLDVRYQAVGCFDLRDPAGWGAMVTDNLVLQQLRAALGYGSGAR